MKNDALNKTLKNLEGSRFVDNVPRVEFKQALIPKNQIKKLMLESGLPKVGVQYGRVVSREGNLKAKAAIDEVFVYRDDHWRGLGMIQGSGLGINPALSSFDAEKQFLISIPESREPKGCICGQILRGLKTPSECSLFANKCTPSNPVGACMVSSEGTCATYYRYRE